ncbi:Os01g0615250, partial [Oryza sativa Japonica Group]
LGELGELVGEGGGVRLLDAAEHEADAALGRRRPEVDHRRDDVDVVVEREHVPGLAEPVVHLVEPHAAPVRHRHRPVVQRHVVVVAAAAAAEPVREPRRERLLRLPHHAHHLRQRRAPHRAAVTGDPHRVHAVAVVPVHRRENAGEQVPRAGGEPEADLGVVGERRRGERAAPEHHGGHGVEGGAGLAAARRGGAEVLLDPRDGLRRDVHHLGHEVERRERRRRPARRGLRRVGDRVAVPHRGHRRRREPPRHLARRLEKLRRALPVEHQVAEADPHRESAAGELGHLHEDEVLELLLGRRAREEVLLGDEERALEVVHVGERAARRGLHEPHPLAGAVHHHVPGGRLRDPAGHRVVRHERPREPVAHPGHGVLLAVRRGPAGRRREHLDEVHRDAHRGGLVDGRQRQRAARGGPRGRDQLRRRLGDGG